MEREFDIVILGSANSDFILQLKSLPQEGETIQANDAIVKNGGKGANQAVAAARLNAKTSFAGKIGNDDNGQFMVKEMGESNVNLEYLYRLDGVQTGQAIILLDQNGNNSIIIIGGANMKYDEKTVLPDKYKQAIKSSKMLLLQKEIPMEINVLAAQYAHENGVIVVADCGGRDDQIDHSYLQNIDYLSPNQTELKRIIGQFKDQQDMDQLLKQQLLDKYKDMKILLKQGSNGCRMITSNIDLSVPAVDIGSVDQQYSIVDTTGAGDCFTAAFFVRLNELLSQNDNLEQVYKESMRFANSAAFLCINKLGAMPSLPYREDVDNFMNQYK